MNKHVEDIFNNLFYILCLYYLSLSLGIFNTKKSDTDVCNQHRTVRERDMQQKNKILNRFSILAYK